MASKGRPLGVKNNPNRTASSLHPTMKMTWKRALKIERIARLSLDPVGYSNAQIANHLGCCEQTVVMIKMTPQYHAKMLELASGVVSLYDQELREDVENARAELRSMVPSSLMVIRDTLLNKKNPNLQFKAAMEVLDREGTMAKVSKSAVAVTQVPNMNVDPAVQNSLLQLLAGAPKSTPDNLIDAATGSFTVNAAKSEIVQGSASEQAGEKSLEILDQISDTKKVN